MESEGQGEASHRKLVVQLALHIRDQVRPHLGEGDRRSGVGASGDVSFPVDRIAEQALRRFLEEWPRPLAYFSEEHGLLGDPAAEHLLVVDPIDGTRPGRLGFEMCTVSVALAPNRPGVSIGEVQHACVAELKGERWFYAARGGETEVWCGGEREPVRLRRDREWSDTPWSLEITGRPFRLLAEAVGPLVDASSLGGGVFCFASASYSITRLLTGQLGAFLDMSDRIRREFPEWEPLFARTGLGRIFSLFSYDIAATVLIARRAGAAVTDAYGRPFDDVSLADVSVGNQLSCVAAANAALHRSLLGAVDVGIERLCRLRDAGWTPEG